MCRVSFRGGEIYSVHVHVHVCKTSIAICMYHNIILSNISSCRRLFLPYPYHGLGTIMLSISARARTNTTDHASYVHYNMYIRYAPRWTQCLFETRCLFTSEPGLSLTYNLYWCLFEEGFYSSIYMYGIYKMFLFVVHPNLSSSLECF